VVHKEGLELLGAQVNRLEHGAHQAAAMADGGNGGRRLLGQERVRARDGGDWLISAREGRLGR
jgi:hypothetical protein